MSRNSSSASHWYRATGFVGFLVALTLLLFTLLPRSVSAAPSSQATATPGQPIRPVLECVVNLGNGQYRAYFGYRNDNSVAVTIPIGGNNKFTPAPENRGQPTSFASGRHYAVYSVEFNGSNLVWKLNTRTATASSSSTPCTSTPTPTPTGSACAVPPLGIATDFNVFVRNGFTQSASDTEGRLAAGGDITLNNYSVGERLDPVWNGQNLLIAGNNLTFTNGRVHRGNAVYSGSATVDYTVVIDGVLQQGTPIDFTSAFATLQANSGTLAGLSASGTTTVQYGGITLNGTNATLNVFAVTGSDLASANNVTINVPNGSAVVVNVNGTTGRMANFGFTLNGATRAKTLYNFYQATTLELTGIGVEGSVLAPFATISFPNGVVHGTLVGQAVSGNGQFNHEPYTACPPIAGGPIPTASPTSLPSATSTSTTEPTVTQTTTVEPSSSATATAEPTATNTTEPTATETMVPSATPPVTATVNPSVTVTTTPSPVGTVTPGTSPTPGDTTPPTSPTTLEVSVTLTDSIGLRWEPATDNIAVVRYDVYVGNDIVASTLRTATFIPGLTPGTAYTFAVRAVDGAGNRSTPSNNVTQSPGYIPPASDTDVPSVPANFRVVTEAGNSATLAWDTATDNVGVVQYEIYSGTEVLEIATATTSTLTSLLPGTTYTLTLRAMDEAGNRSVASAPLTVTTTIPAYRIESISLINGDTGLPIDGYNPIPEGAYIELPELPTQNLHLRANVSGTAESVFFQWQNTSNTQGSAIVESTPYLLTPEVSTDGVPWRLDIGTHVLRATPYDKAGATGVAGQGTSLTFSILNATAPSVHLEIVDDIASEDGTEVATVQLVRTGALTEGLTVDLSYSGSARPGTDVTTLPNRVVLLSGQERVYLDIAAPDDAIAEGTLELVIAVRPAGTYKVGAPNTATITVIDSRNAAPFAEDATILVDNRLSSRIDLSSLIMEPDRDSVTFELVDAPSAQANLNGTDLQYTPQTGYTGLDELTYRVRDGRGGSAEGQITLQVQRINSPPLTDIRSVTLDSTAPATIDLATLAFDQEGDALTYTLEPLALNGQVSLNGTIATYTPTLNYAGNEVVTFRVSDGTASRTGEVQFSVLPNIPSTVNRAPRSDTRSVTMLQGTSAALDLTTLIGDPDNDMLTYEVSTATTTFTGTINLNNNTLTYSPPATFTGVVAIVYTATDPDGNATRAKISFKVLEPGSKPIIRLDVPELVIEPVGHLFTEAGQQQTFTVRAYQYGAEIPVEGAVVWYALRQDTHNAFTFEQDPTDPTKVTVTANGPVGYLQLKALADGITSASATALAVELESGVVVVPDTAILSDEIVGLVVSPGERLDRVRLDPAQIAAPVVPGMLMVAQGTAPIRGRVVSVATVANSIEVLLTTEDFDTVFAGVEFDFYYSWEDRVDYTGDPTQSLAFYESLATPNADIALSSQTRLPGRASQGSEVLNLPGFMQVDDPRTPTIQPPAPIPPGGPIEIPPVPDVPDNDAGINCRLVPSRLRVPDLRPTGIAVECVLDYGSQRFTRGSDAIPLPGGGTIKGQFDGTVSIGTFTVIIDIAGGGGFRTTTVTITDEDTGEVLAENTATSLVINFAIEATGTFALKATGGGKIEADFPWPAGRFQVGPFTAWPVPVSAIAVFTPTTSFVAEFKGDVDFSITKRFTIECNFILSRASGFAPNCEPTGFNPRFDPARSEGVRFTLGEEASVSLNLTVLNVKTDAYVGVLGEIEHIRRVGREFAQFCRTVGRRGPEWIRRGCNATAQVIEDALKIENRLLGLKGDVRVGFIEFKVKGDKGIGPRYDYNVPLPDLPTLPPAGTAFTQFFGYADYGFGYQVDLPIVGWVARGEGWAQDQLRRYFDLDLPRLPTRLYKRGDIGYPSGAGSPLPPEGNITDRPQDNRIPSRICGKRPSGTPSSDPFPQPAGIFEFPSDNPTVRVSCRTERNYCADGVSYITEYQQRTEYLDGTIRRYFQFEPNVSFDIGGGGSNPDIPRIGPGGGSGSIRNVTVFITKAKFEGTNCQEINLFRPVGTVQRVSDYKWRWFVEDMPHGQYEFVALATPSLAPPSILDLYAHLLRNNTTLADPFVKTNTDRFSATIGNGCVEEPNEEWQVVETEGTCPSPQPSQRPPRRPPLPGRNNGGGWPDIWRGGGSGGPRRLPSGGGAGGPGGPGSPPIQAEPGGSGWGDPHLSTIDGATYTSLQLGEFVYARNIVGDPGAVEVQARHERISGFPDWASFITVAAIRAGGHTYEVRLPENPGTPLQLLIDGQVSDLVPGTYQYGTAVLEIRADNAITVWTEDENGNITRVDSGTLSEILLGSSTEPVISLKVTMSTARDGAYRGLLGTPDGLFENEFTARDGSVIPVYDTFIESWRITTRAESIFTYPGGAGPETYNLPQDATIPDLAYLEGDNPFGRNYIQEARDLLTGTCSADLTLVDFTFIRSVAFEMAAGRSVDNLLASGLCEDEHLLGPSTEDDLLVGLVFGGQVRLQGQPAITIPGVRVVISAPQLGGEVLCDTTTFAEGAYDCSLTDFAAFFNNQSTLDLLYRVTGRGDPITATTTIPLPAPGDWAEQRFDLEAAPTNVLHLTGRLFQLGGEPLAGGLIRISGPAFIQGAADENGNYDLYLPIPDGYISGDLEYEVFDQASNHYTSLFKPFTITGPGIVEIQQDFTVEADPLPPGDEGGEASQSRQLIINGIIRNSLDNNNGVAGLQVSITSPVLAGGRCDTRTGADGGFTCNTNVLTDSAFTVLVRGAGLGPSEVVELSRPVTTDEIPALGSSQVIAVELTGAFQTRRLTLQGLVVNTLVSGEAVLADSVVIRSPQLGRLCEYSASNFSSFSCQARVVITQPFDLEYVVTGEWGVTQATTRVNTIPPTGDINASVTLQAAPTTLDINGTLTDGTNPIANVPIQFTSPFFDRTYSITTNAQGRYQIRPYINIANPISGTISASYALNNASEVSTFGFTNPIPNAVNVITRSLVLNERRINFNGNIVNSLTNQPLNVSGEVTIRRDGTDLCTTYVSTSYYCSRIISGTTAFTVTYEVSGTWGSSGVVTAQAPAGTVGGNANFTRNLTVVPTTVQLTGRVLNSGNTPISGASVYLQSTAFVNGTVYATTNNQGVYTVYAVLPLGVTGGNLEIDVYANGTSQRYTRSFTGATTNGLTTVSNDFTFVSRTVYFRGTLSNALVSGRRISDSLVGVTLSNGSTCSTNVYYSDGRYGCGIVITGSDPLTVSYTVSGGWGSQDFTASIPGGFAGTEFLQDFNLSPTTVLLRGRISSSSGPVANASVAILRTYNDPIHDSLNDSTDTQGDYELYIVLNEGISTIEIPLQVYANGVTVSQSANLTTLTPNTLNTTTQNVTFDTLNLRGSITNANAPEVDMSNTSVTISTGSTVLCTTTTSYYSGQYDCNTAVSISAPFTATYVVSGTWGSEIFTDTITGSSIGGTFEKDMLVAPTTLRITGTVYDLGGNPVPYPYLYLYDNNDPTIVAMNDYDYSNEQGVYTATVVLNQGVTSGTLTYYVDPYYNGESSSGYGREFDRAFSGLTPGVLNTTTEDFAFTERPLDFEVDLRNGHVPGTYNYLSFNEIEVWSNGTMLCSGSYRCRLTITSNDDFEVEYRVRGNWGSATATDTVRPSLIGTDNRIQKAIVAYPTTVRLTGTLQDSNGNPITYYTNVYASSPSFLASYGDTIDGQGQYEMYAVVRDGFAGGQIEFQIYSYYSGSRTYTINYDVSTQGGQLVPLSNDFTYP
jgi:choice-of-anchor A domain-containing protein